jgi:hypothetical protein
MLRYGRFLQTPPVCGTEAIVIRCFDQEPEAGQAAGDERWGATPTVTPSGAADLFEGARGGATAPRGLCLLP